MKITLTFLGFAVLLFVGVWLNSLLHARTMRRRWEVCRQQAAQIVANIKAQYPGCEGAVMMAEPKNDLKVVRDTFTAINNQLCASTELLSEPLKGMFTSIKKEFDNKLAQLPPTEQVPASLDLGYQLQSLLSCLYSVDTMIGLLNQSLKGMSTQQASLVAEEIGKQIKEGVLVKQEDVAAQVATEVEAKVTAGELVAKDAVVQLCAQAETNGIAKGEAKLRTELEQQAAATAQIATRKTTLATAGVVITDAEAAKILGGTDEEFATRQKRYETRLTELTGKGFSLNAPELLVNLWKEDAEYGAFVNVITAIPALKGQGEPFAKGPTPAPTGARRPMLL